MCNSSGLSWPLAISSYYEKSHVEKHVRFTEKTQHHYSVSIMNESVGTFFPMKYIFRTRIFSQIKTKTNRTSCQTANHSCQGPEQNVRSQGPSRRPAERIGNAENGLHTSTVVSGQCHLCVNTGNEKGHTDGCRAIQSSV